jgi:protein tyrosine/serine phosphatase
MRFPVRSGRIARRLAAAAMATLAVCGSALGLQRLDGNFHAVVPGELYRSAQPSASDIGFYASDYGIRTVLNLRGAQPGTPWYDTEKAAVDRLGLTLIDFPMSASSDLTPARAKALVAMLRSARKPILVHCNAGSDRTGLVSVIFSSQVAGIDEEDAEEQRSPFYGHLGIPLLSPTFAMDRSWEELEPLFGITGS